MRALKAKLNSRRGASLLLALLFFLIALLVGASVLMAAASNGGKAKSNRDEQQAYLTLSSALQLVVDDINGATYSGAYQYERTGRGSSSNHRYHTYTQQPGECSTEFLKPFRSVLDQEFENRKTVPQNTTVWGNYNNYSWKSDVEKSDFPPDQKVTAIFYLSVSGDPQYNAITAETVKVELTMNNDFTVSATATITTTGSVYEDYSMEAEFLATSHSFSLRNYTNGTETISESENELMITWEFSRIAKGWAS